MSKNALTILAALTANVTTANTANTQENPMNPYLAPFSTSILADGETPATLTVTRKGAVVLYLSCTAGAMFIEAPVPEERSVLAYTRTTEVRNTRDHDYLTRLLALNGYLQAGDIVEVKATNSGYLPVERFEVTDLFVAPRWSYCSVRQPVENVLVNLTLRSCRYYGDGGGWSDRFTGKTDSITGVVEPDLSRW